MPKNKKCQFKTTLLGFVSYSCPEPALEGSDYCIFHKLHKTEEEVKLFKKRIKEKLQNEDYDFIGYYFSKKTAEFANVIFKGKTNFEDATFEGEANFQAATFKGEANFEDATFEEYANFEEATFEQPVFFGALPLPAVTFKGEANFQEATFKGKASFEGTTFEGNTNFEASTFERIADFREITFERKVNFEDVAFDRITNFEGATFKHNPSAEQVFRIAKNSHQKQGEYTLAGEYYYKERVARRKQLPWYKRSFEYTFLDGICGYGERPLRAIRTGLGVVFGLAFLYWRIGHIYPSPELFKEPHTLTFLDALYFSVVTFTTLGFGDWRPDPSHWIRYVVMSEAFIGAFLMALFIVTFARRMMR